MKIIECGQNSCGTIGRKIVGGLPDDDTCDPLELDVRLLF